MSWIALRSATEHAFAPAGLGEDPAEPAPVPDAPIVRGTLLVDFRPDPAVAHLPLLAHATSRPWPTGLTLALAGDGTLELTTWQGPTRRSCRLPLDARSATAGALILYTWDAPKRRGSLSLLGPDGTPRASIDTPPPLPPTWRDAGNIATDARTTRLSPATRFAAMADAILPRGPWPGLDPDAPVTTPTGARAIGTLRRGDIVCTAGGRVAQIRWTGGIELPARGQLAPVCLRAPYRGTRDDVIAAPFQKLEVSGPEVEYQLGTERALCAAGHLVNGRCVRHAPGGPVRHYRQVILDGPGLLDLEGLPVEPLLPSTFAGRRNTLLDGFPEELMPRPMPRHPIQLMREFEAAGLANRG